MARNIRKIADKLGARVIRKVHEAGGGAFGAIRICALVAKIRARRNRSSASGLLILSIIIAGCGQNREPSSDTSASETAVRVEIRLPTGHASRRDIVPNANLAEIKTQLTPTVQQAIQNALDARESESGELVRFAIVCQSRESEQRQIEFQQQQQVELKMTLSPGTIEYRILLKPADGSPGVSLVTERRASETDEWRQINGSSVAMNNRPRKIEPWVVGHIVDSMADPIDTWNQFSQADLPR